MSSRVFIVESNGEFAVVNEITKEYFQYTDLNQAINKIRDILQEGKKTETKEDEDYSWGVGV